jgi:GT2 family glycosyltransferase
MKISVVIPTYNRLESLKNTLHGLSIQNYTNSEVIVVDDGSTDGTSEFLSDLSSRMPLKVVPQSNGGPSKARNRGVEEATGEIIVFIDDDTEPESDFLESHAALHREISSLAVIGPMICDKSRKEPVWIAWEHAMLQKQYTALEKREWWPPGPNHFYTGNASLRREDFLAIGGFDLSFTRQEDVELAFRLQKERGVGFHFAPETAVVHRPLRTFESWQKVPLAYGALDVERARRGDVSWELVRHGFAGRSALTRLLIKTEWAAPMLSPALRLALKLGAIGLHRLGLVRPACAMLSALYNLLYLDGAKVALGGLRELKEAVV